jgi:hypothetical protein
VLGPEVIKQNWKGVANEKLLPLDRDRFGVVAIYTSPFADLAKIGGVTWVV